MLLLLQMSAERRSCGNGRVEDSLIHTLVLGIRHTQFDTRGCIVEDFGGCGEEGGRHPAVSAALFTFIVYIPRRPGLGYC